MGNRIATIQRQARELGRLRTGTYDGRRPVRSKTWVITSHAEHYVQAAAEVWGGTPEKWQPQGNGAAQWRVITEAVSLDALLPPGDPLSQDYETWSRGGVQRRCDGMTESLTDQPCLCRAQWGDAFHETAPRDAACKMTTRLNVILPEMPDIGAWRVETHSFYSANEMAAAVDMLKGAIGDRGMIPVRLRIEQRTRVSQGQTKHFPVVAVELRGVTAGQVLNGAGGQVMVLTAPTTGSDQAPAAAIAAAAEPVEPAPLRDFVAEIQQAPTRDDVLSIWNAAKRAPHANATDVEAAAKARVAELEQPPAVKQGAPKLSVDEHIKAAFDATTMDQLTAALERAQNEGHAPDLAAADDPVAAAFMGRRQLLATPETPAAPAADPERLWAEIVTAASLDGFDRTDDLEKAFAARWNGDTPGAASATQLATFLAELRDGKVRPPQAATAAATSSAPAEDQPPF